MLSLFLLLRVIHLDADPPINLSWSGGLFGDEGAYAHNARNKVLFGTWITDEWNPILYNPISTFFTYISFRIFGVGLIQLRFVNVIATFLGLILIFFALKKAVDIGIALLSIFLLGVNYIFLMYSRIGLNDTFLIFFLALTIFFLCKGMDKNIYLTLTGISCFASFVCKSTSLYFLIAVLMAFSFYVFQKFYPDDKKRILRAFSYFFVGIIGSFCLWLVLYFFPYHHLIASYGSSWSGLAFPKSINQFLVNLSQPHLFKYFTRTPIILLTSWLYIPFLLFFLINDWKKINFIELLSLLWLIGGYIAINGLNYCPLRYFISLIPPMCILSSFAISRLSKIYPTNLNRKKLLLFSPIIILWTVVVIKLVIRYFDLEDFIKGVIAFIIILAFFYSLQIVLKKRALSPIVFTVILLSVAINGKLFYNWVSSPRHTVLSTSRILGTNLNNAYIAGLWAPLICLENSHKALAVGKGWFNDKNTFEKFPITHLFLWDGNNKEELRFFQKSYPKIMDKAKLLKIFYIQGKPTRLFELE